MFITAVTSDLLSNTVLTDELPSLPAEAKASSRCRALDFLYKKNFGRHREWKWVWKLFIVLITSLAWCKSIIFSHRSKAAPQMAVSACQSPHWSRTNFINIKGLVMEFSTNTRGGQRWSCQSFDTCWMIFHWIYYRNLSCLKDKSLQWFSDFCPHTVTRCNTSYVMSHSWLMLFYIILRFGFYLVLISTDRKFGDFTVKNDA